MLAWALLGGGFQGRAASPEPVSNPAGDWSATTRNPSGESVEFGLEIALPAVGGATGAIVNGDDRIESSSGTFDGRTLVLRYDFYDATLTARIEGDTLQGQFVRQWRTNTLTRELSAKRHRPEKPATEEAADLSGEWVLKVGEGEQQRLWRAAFQTKGGRASGTVIPVSGDWGAMAGSVSNRTLTLHRFDGISARWLKLAQQPDGTLKGSVDLGLFEPKRSVVAERISAANRDLVADLPNPNTHTRLRRPGEPFRFRYPDLEGHPVAWDDARFRGKVVVVSITGTWCPTCHEEAPFLQELYARHRAQGLEVVGLAFEYTGEPERDRKQLRIFARRHGLTYPLLLAGSTDEAKEKLAQLENFGAYPTTLFIGRDGRVRRIHAGFDGQATGERFSRLKTGMESLIRELLAEPANAP